MIKRVFAMLAVVLPGMAAFGLDIPLSVGGGALVGGMFTRYTLDAKGTMPTMGGPVPVDVVSTQEINQVNYGGFLFVDAAWAQLNLDIRGGNDTWQDSIKVGNFPANESKGAGTETTLGISLLGKYPFRLNPRLSVFPLAGLEYRIALREYRDGNDRTDEPNSKGGAYTLADWNSLLIDVGAGLDFDLPSRLFLRAELLYGFRLQTPYEKDGVEKVKKQFAASNPALKGLTSGPTLRLALGWRILDNNR